MARIILIRHAHHSLLGKRYVSRAPGVNLSEIGRRQAVALAARLADYPIEAVFSSPLERARQTAEPIASARAVQVQIRQGLNEIDIGKWTNLTIEEAEREPLWHEWNQNRSATRPPGGELMAEVQDRMTAAIAKIAAMVGSGCAVAVSHGDPIKAALLGILGTPIDNFLRFEIDPASVTVIEHEPKGKRLLLLNDTGDLPV